MDDKKKDRQSNQQVRIPGEIIAFARQHGINLTDDPELLEIIENINIDKKLPEEVYSLIAEIIFQVYKIKDRWKSK